MKKLLAVMTVAVVAVAGVAVARQQQRVTNEDVDRVIDARLHQMLVKLNHSRR